MTVALWLAELALELSGAFLSFRRRLTLLGYLLAVRAAFDIVTLAIQPLFGFDQAYAWSWLTGQVAQFAMLTVLVCRIAARLLKDYRPVNVYAWLLGGIVAGLTIAAWIKGDSILHRWLDAQVAAGMSLIGSLLLASAFKKAKLGQPWLGVAMGAAVHLAGVTGCAMIWESWPIGARLYAAPAIAALLVWNVSAWRKPRPETRAVQVERAPKIEPQGVYVEFEQRRVM